jgi:hypothetical protein
MFSDNRFGRLFERANEERWQYVMVDSNWVNVDTRALNEAYENGWRLHSTASNQARSLFIFERRPMPRINFYSGHSKSAVDNAIGTIAEREALNE